MAASPTAPSRWRRPLLVLGWALVALAPVVGLVPGPGGVFVLAGGLVLLLRNSCWVRRRYVRMKRRWPRVGHFADRTLRRGAMRRQPD